MTASCFEQLTEAVQTDIVWESGRLLARRKDGYYSVLLFQIDGFYTELYYHTHFNVIIKIESFSDTDLLEPYLKDIPIATLFDGC